MAVLRRFFLSSVWVALLAFCLSSVEGTSSDITSTRRVSSPSPRPKRCFKEKTREVVRCVCFAVATKLLVLKEKEQKKRILFRCFNVVAMSRKEILDGEGNCKRFKKKGKISTKKLVKVANKIIILCSETDVIVPAK